MLTITSTDLPEYYPLDLCAIAGIMESNLSLGYAVTGLYQSKGQLEGVVSVPVFDDKIQVTLTDIGAVTSVIIGQHNYSFSPDLTPGTYSFSVSSQTLTINPLGSVRTGQIITYFAIPLKVVPVFDDKIQVTLTDIGAVTSVTIGQQNYSFSPDLTPGTYSFSASSQTLTINPLGTVRTGQIITYFAIPLKVAVRSTQILKNIPLVFKTWNCQGQIRLQSNFEKHPNCSLSFLTEETLETSVKTQFFPGNSFIFYGIGYQSAGYTITHYPQSNKIKADIQLIGTWAPRGDRSLLDQPIKLKPFIGKTITLNQLGSSLGLSQGGPSISFSIDKNTSDEATTTFRRELETRAGTVGGFVDYTNPQAPQIKVFGSTATHFLSRSDVLQKEWAIAYQGQGANYNGVALYSEINNLKLKLEKSDSQEDEEITLFEGDPNPEIPPNIEKKEFRSNTLAFDLGGPIKTQREIKMLNSTTLKEVVSTWGFVYTEADTHVVSKVTRLEDPNDPNSSVDTYDIRFAEPTFDNYWQEVKNLKINHVYNSKTGDYEAAPGIGWELMRYLRSNDNLEICQLQGAKLITDDASEQAKLQKVIDAYRFFRNPVDSATNFELEPFKTHYEDITQSDNPKFAKSSTKTEKSFATIPDPRTGENNETRPPLVTGTRKVQEMRRTIAPTKAEIYKETETVKNAEGNDFNQTAQSQSHRDMKGRPPVQPRLQKYERTPEGKTPNNPKLVYRLNTPNSLSTLSTNQLFPLPSGIKDLAIALKFIRTQISKENSQNAVKLNLKIIRHSDWTDGDIIIFEGIRWLLLSVNETQLIKRGSIWYRPVEIELGQLLEPPVSATVDKN